MAEGKTVDEPQAGVRKRPWKKILVVVLLGLAVYRYTQLDESKKRFIKHLLKQVPYLPARYFA